MRVDFNSNVKSPKRKELKSHSILILDKSGSMRGSKIDVANEMVQAEIKQKLFESYTIIAFSDHSNIQVYDGNSFSPVFADGLTALHDGVYKGLEKGLELIKDGSNVLIKVFTDGGENNSIKRASDVKKLISQFPQDKLTLTFAGTEQDTLSAINMYDLDESNTITHNNTKESFEKMRGVTLNANISYRKSFDAGEDVTKSFYSKSIK